MSAPRVLVAGRPLPLDRQIGKGGEGVVYLVAGDHNQAVKLYTDADRLAREDKIAAMLKHRLANQTTLAAFPLAMVHQGDGTFAGFVMRVAVNHRPIHELYAPGSRKQHFPQADYRFLARSATNIAKAFASVHQLGCVVGDINHSGVFVSNKATATLIDADSFQFTAGGQQFLCKVGVPEYTPPELQGKPLTGVVRTPDHDAFGLAVVLFQVLLMGRHPFVGTIRKGEMPPMDENIRNFRFVYAEDRDVGMDQPPGTPALSDFSAELATLFNRAFSKGSVGRRPTSKDWIGALERFEGSLIQCADNPLHYGPKDTSECPWCEMERSLNSFLFLPYFGGTAGLGSAGPSPSVVNFDIRVIWARIERIQAPRHEEVKPRVSLTSPDPTQRAKDALSQKDDSGSATGVFLVLGGFALLLLVPAVWLLAVFLIGAGAKSLSSKSKKAVDASPFRDEFVQAKQQWYREVDGWRRRIGLDELLDLRRKLTEAKDRYTSLEADERAQVQEYRKQRRDLQLRYYLEGFDVARAGVKGIGHSKLAALASYGIDTAADVTAAKLSAVPGFGEALTGRMLTWRRHHEARFVYNAADNDADRREIARIKALIEGKAAPLRTTLTSGAQELEARLARLNGVVHQIDPVLQKVSQRVDQAQVDLIHLSQPLPTVAPPPAPRPPPSQAPSSARGSYSPQPSRVPAPAPTAPGRPTAGTTPSCPRCGSSMRQRKAMRGRNAGNYFWGCSRYPSCKGTRNI